LDRREERLVSKCEQFSDARIWLFTVVQLPAFVQSIDVCWFSAVFNEMVQYMMTICEYTIKKIIVIVIEDVVEARQFRVAVSSSFASLYKRL